MEGFAWAPATRAQQAAMDSEADILFFGGSAGSLKTETMLMDAVQEYENPNLRAIVFRASFQEMTDIVDKTRRLYSPLGGKWVGSPKWMWTFPSGATIRFGYMKTDEDVWKYLGPRYCVAKGTPVLMADGSHRAIEAIGAGDMVQTLEGPRAVTRTHGPMLKDCVACTVDGVTQVHPKDHRLLFESGEWGSYASLAGNQTYCVASCGDSQETLPPQGLCVRVALHVPDLRSGSRHSEQSSESRSAGKSEAPLGLTTADRLPEYWDLQPQHAPLQLPGDRESMPSFDGDTSGALLGLETGEGSQYRCDPLLHLRGERLPARSSNVPTIAPLLDGATPRSHPYRTQDGLGTSGEHTRESGSYCHPYSGKPRERLGQLGSSVAFMHPVGEFEVYDLTVSDSNHYVTEQNTISVNSFIGYDESTLHTEKQVRNILGRLSSTDPSLRLRMRLTSNPGNVGAAWHQALFLRGECPIHNPGASARPGQLYRDRVWPSDKQPIPFSVAFIPGKLSDHNLLDADYAKRLHMMAGGSAAAMETGCWCSLEGSYFSFVHNGLIRPLAEIGMEWWHSHFLSIDYGYGKSSSSVGLYVRSPSEAGCLEGRIRKIGELVAPHVPAYELAAMVVERFIQPTLGGQRRRIIAAYLDPSNFKDIGDGHTIADQINEVLEPWDVVCERASNDRLGGWQLLYRMLRTGEFEITDVCPQTFEAIRTRMHDEKKPGDIRKVSGDPLDDVADETRYAIYTFVNQSEKPRELVLAEAVQGIDRSTREGMTSAVIRWQQKTEELDREEEPIRMTGFASRRFGRRR